MMYLKEILDILWSKFWKNFLQSSTTDRPVLNTTTWTLVIPGIKSKYIPMATEHIYRIQTVSKAKIVVNKDFGHSTIKKSDDRRDVSSSTSERYTGRNEQPGGIMSTRELFRTTPL